MSFAVAFTGHRKISSDFNLYQTRLIIEDCISRGADTFYCGMACGFDMICCQLLTDLKKDHTIKIVACIPCKDQSRSFSSENKLWYDRLLLQCDEKVILSEHYFNGCMQLRDRYMVDRAQEVVAYLNTPKTGTAYTVDYAIKKDKKIIYVNR